MPPMKQPWHTEGYNILADAFTHLMQQFYDGEITREHWESCLQVFVCCGREIRNEHRQAWAVLP